MSRDLIYLNGAWFPPALAVDTSAPRVFNDITNPAATGVALIPGDQWLVPSAPPAPPVNPPPPSTYVPRVVSDYSTFKPDNDNTGIVTSLDSHKPYNYPGTTAITVTQDGKTFTSLDIYGDIKIQAKNVVFEDCIFRGPRNWPSNDGAVIDCNSDSCVNLLVRDSTYAPQLPNYYRDFIIGHEYTAERNRSIWGNDHYGIYNRVGKTYATNARVKGCYATDDVYWQGTAAQYPGQSVGSFTVTTTWGTSFTVPGYPLKPDGSHNDGIQIQGGKGPSRSIWCISNKIRTYDAWAEVHLLGNGHPLGWGDPIPQLGTGNNPKLYTYKGTTPNPMLDGHYGNNGQSFVIQQNTVQFDHIDTCVVEYNDVSDGGQGFNIQANGGGFSTIQATVQHNAIGRGWYNYNAGNPQIYVVRVDHKAGATIAGLSTNYWAEPCYGNQVGDPLTVGRTTGLWYDS